jgi:hypothetical protein
VNADGSWLAKIKAAFQNVRSGEPEAGRRQRSGEVKMGQRGRLEEEGSLVCYPPGMGSIGLKQRIVETVEHLPDDATVEYAVERLYFLAKIERGLEQADAGQGLSQEDVKKRFVR